MTLAKPFHLNTWLAENRHHLQPPVCNKALYHDDLIVMIVGGPNQRKDYHIDPGGEFFYQLQGEMTLHTMQAGKPVPISIKQGEMFFLPPMVPHSPQRFANTIGLVVERKRQADEKDGFAWYCEACHHRLHQVQITLSDIERDLPIVFQEFYNNPQLRTCQACGACMQPPALSC